MSVFKCKMCGGELDIIEGSTIAKCLYCKTKQTIPNVMDENMQNLFNRANVLRMKGEFDKAERIYEKIVQSDDTQSEAYWGLILCKYGIEYVDDPNTNEKIPTCHRASYDSIIADEDYKSAIENADSMQKGIYENQAKEIDRIQKEILALAQKEETYDVFICYKETDSSGRRTQDSVIANDIYYQLTNEGFKVFYAAITLEGKLGSAYEPIIFAALNSAKAMLVIGTNPDYFNAVWVKNEWSRYLKIIQKDRSKLLIPCYRDMDAYELPEEFAHLQAQDMAKIGFINDLIRGIKKIIKKDEPKPVTAVKETIIENNTVNVESLLKRAFMFLEDGNWKSADEYCEKVLDQDPENSKAYLGKLMADLHIKKEEDLKNQAEPFDKNENYQKVIRFSDEKLKENIKDYLEHIKTRNENNEKIRIDNIYNHATRIMRIAKSEIEFKEAAGFFREIGNYRDSSNLAEQCLEKIEEIRCIKKEEKKKCNLLIRGLKFFCRSEVSIISIDDKTDKENYSLMIQLNDSFAMNSDWQQITQEINLVNNEIVLIEMKISKLKEEKSSLCFFAVKQKKEIAESISRYKTEVNSLKMRLQDANGRYIEIIRTELNRCDYGASLLKQYDQLSNIMVGQYIKFGTYEQDNKKSNSKEDIEWLVLDVKQGKALVISKYCLEIRPYDGHTWKTCSLREWLNKEFLTSAFSDNEKAIILKITLSSNNYSTPNSNDTKDRVFLLSIEEIQKYFPYDNQRLCERTEYAARIYTDKGESNLESWWSRSDTVIFGSEKAAKYVNRKGEIASLGTYWKNGVRPAMWINLN